jgi:FtsH-binding integral membrane protein
MFKSFVLRMSLILSITAVICLLLMVATLVIQEEPESMTFCSILFGIMLVWLMINWFIVRKVDPELSVEVARILLPTGALLSLVLSSVLSLYLDAMIPGTEGKQHFILPFVGVGVALFLVVRCFDIKWMRGEDELTMLENRED